MTGRNIDDAIERVRSRIKQGLEPDVRDVSLLIEEIDRCRRDRKFTLATPEWWGKGTGD